ncbi:bZIP transcription factor [Diaporthe amygdali]|uniref:bZIP transcription factor n=1 Tax=Phomopsis amygdali TaxID=1214568 RepID=UPI0022FEFE95|nr:bZIP transcription factor [Diaporthe amygdali]KAJ0100737.1 bZIP transcription factor [Diaporthe amygdali]
MDHSQTDCFVATQEPYHQSPISIPVLKFARSNSTGSEDFSTTLQSDASTTARTRNTRISIEAQLGPIADPDAHCKGLSPGETITAQSRRRAQNRDAQRAFRKRKAQHVKDFEAKVASLVTAQNKIASENERLKRDLQEVSLENALLKATLSINGGHLPGHDDAPVRTWPLQYNSHIFCTNFPYPHPNETPNHRIATNDSDERFYTAGTTWDYMTSHNGYKTGLADTAGTGNRVVAERDQEEQCFEEKDKSFFDAFEETVNSECGTDTYRRFD